MNRFLEAGENYDDVKAVNWSSLKHILTSPRHYRAALAKNRSDEESTPAMQFGVAFHCAMLEADRFREEFVSVPDFGNLQTKAARAERDAWMVCHRGRPRVADKDRDRIRHMLRCVYDEAPAAELLAQTTAREVGAVWADEATGILCKGRIDALTPSHVLDVKTAQSVDPGPFSQRAARYMYHAQLAFYVDGVRAVTGQDRAATIIAVESSVPFDCAVFELDEDTLNAGRDMYAKALRLLQQCQQEARWPGVGGGIALPFRLPAWAINSDDDLSELGLE